VKIICRARQQGKTTEIIKIAAENFSYVVCRDYRSVERVAAQAKEMGLNIPYPITMEEFINGKFHGRGMKSIAIDNAEDILRRFAKGVPISAASIEEG